ncbi:MULTISPECIES: hypothetical protein [unclassified Variovorax]|uniref:hypothetical protein n=1 Tax=unclassified Variovorax TaxID=663243 RepID=UPI001BD3ADCF|nr:MULTISPECIES: hypothetical protein [unclassified Variovorax]
MEKIIVYVDDAAYARDHMARLVAPATDAAGGARHWILVACAPRMTHRISKWVSHSARENWRAKWFAKTVAEVTPVLCGPGDQITPSLATGRLADMTQQLRLAHGASKVIDARRPKLGVDLEPVAPDVPAAGHSGWALPGAVVGMGALLVLANELGE